MANKYTTWETNLASIATANLSSSYEISNKYSMSSTPGAKIYKVLIQHLNFDKNLDAGTACFGTFRQNFVFWCFPLAGATDDTVTEQCNIMLEDVTEMLEDYSLVNAISLGTETITEINVNSGGKVTKSGRLAIQILFSFLADE